MEKSKILSSTLFGAIQFAPVAYGVFGVRCVDLARFVSRCLIGMAQQCQHGQLTAWS